LEGDCHEIEVPPNLEMLVNLGMSLGGSLSWALYVVSLQANT
jgi:hypothetical protein